MDKFSYALGLGIGQQLKQMGLKDTLVIEDFAASIVDVLQDNDLKVSNQEAQVIVSSFFQKKAGKKAGKAGKAGSKAAEGEIAAAIALALRLEGGNETEAAIALALDRYLNESVHDNESYVITIRRK